MKYRNGFVSNSSSSSFVVAFPKRPESVEELKGMIFGDEEIFYDPYPEDKNNPNGWTTQEIAEAVFSQIRGKEPVEPHPVVLGSFLTSGYYDGMPDSEEASEEMSEQQIATRFLKGVEGKVLFEFSFSDNDGSMQCAMEHGDLFKRLPFLYTSHH